MALEQTLTKLQDLNFPTQIRESVWMFPTIETVHVFALVLVVGSIMTVDLRLLGSPTRSAHSARWLPRCCLGLGRPLRLPRLPA